jgi:hypothetical protein
MYIPRRTSRRDGYVRGLMWVWKPKKPAGPSGLTKAMQQQGE